MQEKETSLDVSVIVRTKDRPVLLARAIKSLSNQTSKNFEVVVINDGGNADPVEDILSGTPLPEYIVHSNLESIGRAKAFNQALKMARGRYIACLDDDDTYEPKFIENMVKALDREIAHAPLTAGIISRCTEIYEKLLNPSPKNYHDFASAVQLVRTDVLFTYNCASNYVSPYFYFVGRENFLPVQTLFKRSALLGFGGFSVANDVLEDRPLYFKILGAHKVAVLEENLANHHTRVSSPADAHSNSMFDNSTYDWSKRFSEFYIEGYYETESNKALHFTIIRDALLDLKWDLTSTKSRRQEFNSHWKNIWRLIRNNKLASFAIWLVFVLSMITYSAIGTALVLYLYS